MEVKENNEFIDKKLLEPRAKIDPKFYEYAALYVGLYQSIYGSFEDYGFTDRAAVDVYITAKIKTMVKVIDKILKANPDASYEKLMNLKESDFPPDGTLVMPSLSSSDSHFTDEKIAFDHIIKYNWIGNYFPLLKTPKTIKEVDPATGAVTKREETVVKNNNYASEYLNNFDRSLAIAQDLTSKLGDRSKSGNMMTVDDARHMLKAEQNQLSELFEGYRASSEGQPFKFDKDGAKDGKRYYKSGAYYEAFRGAGSDSAINKLKEKNSFIRRSWGKFLLKSIGLIAVGAVTVASAAMLLSVGGITLSSIFGTAFAGMGLGSAVTGGIGTLLGGTIFTRLGSSWVKEIGSLYGKYRDRDHFMNGIGKYATKEGKMPQGYKKLREQYYTALGLKDYFIHGDMKKLDRRCRKYVKKYLKENPGLEKNKYFYNYVDGQSGTFQTLYRKLNNVVQGVPENQGRRRWTNDVVSDINKVVKGTTDFDKIIEAAKLLNDYQKEIGDTKVNDFKVALASSFDNAFKENIYHQPYTKFTPQIGSRKDVKEVKEFLEYSPDGAATKRVDANITYLNTIRSPYLEARMPLKLDATLGVSIEEQISLKENTITAACERLCNNLTDDEKIKVRSIATNLQNMKTMDESATIATELSTFARTPSDPSFENVKTYLKKMLDKRMITSKYRSNHVENAIINASRTTPSTASATAVRDVSSMIENLSRNADGEFETSGKKGIADIRATIMDSSNGFSEEQRTAALDMLDKQVRAIENREYLQTEANLLPVMQEGRFNAITDSMKFIGELKFEDISSAKLNDWYTDKVARNSNKAFLDVQLKNKLESLVMSEADTEKYKAGTAESFDAICKFIKSVKSCKMLDTAQTTRIILSMSKNIEKAVHSKITTAKLNFANSYNMSDFAIFLDLINENNPLREYLELNTPETKAIESEIQYMASFNTLYQFVNTGITINGMKTKTNEEEAKGFSYAYMLTKDRRDSSDKLYKIIARMSNLAASGSASNEKLTITPPPAGSRNNLEFADKMKEIINNLFDTSNGYTADEKYAALIVMKNICVSIFKTHFEHYVSNKVGSMSLDAYMAEKINKEDYKKTVLNSWIYDDNTAGSSDEDKLGLINLIEYKLEEVINDPALSQKCKMYSYKKVKNYLESSGERSSSANFRQDVNLYS